jgi:hypothetical protein
VNEPRPERLRTWWDDVDDDLAAAGAEEPEELPDPWAEAAGDVARPALTADQEAFLAGLDDQPAVPRLSGFVDDEDADGT